MAKEVIKWNPTCKRFVAFIDIMGFREMVLRRSHKEVRTLLESFQPTIGEIEEHAKKVLSASRQKARKTNREKTVVRVVSFSDSIILVSSDDSEDSAFDIFFEVEWILREAIIKGIPMKGVISYGEQTANFEKSLHFGRPLIDAFELQNELLLYGVILHHTMEKHLIGSDNLEVFKNFDIFKYSVPMKSGKIIHYILDWTWKPEHENDMDLIDVVSQLYQNVSGNARLYVDNTLEFVRWLAARKLELKEKKEAPSRPSIRRK
jgi:hypothetical protein